MTVGAMLFGPVYGLAMSVIVGLIEFVTISSTGVYGLIMNVLAMVRELPNPTDEQIKEYLAGNLCRCTGYQSHLRAIKKYLVHKQKEAVR